MFSIKTIACIGALISVTALTIAFNYSQNYPNSYSVTTPNPKFGNYGLNTSKDLTMTPQSLFRLTYLENITATLSESLSNSFVKIPPTVNQYLPKWFRTTDRAKVSGRIIIVGDSHAEQFVEWAKSYAMPRGFDVADLTLSACPFLDNVQMWETRPMRPTHCSFDVQQQRMKEILNSEPSFVFMASRWCAWVEEHEFRDHRNPPKESWGGWRSLQNHAHNLTEKADRQLLFKNRLRETISIISNAGHRVVLMYPIPEAYGNVVKQLQSTIQKNTDLTEEQTAAKMPLTLDQNVFKSWCENTHNILDTIDKHSVHLTIYPEAIFCNTLIKGQCVTHDSRSVFYRDYHHLGKNEGALLLLKPLFANIFHTQQ